MIESQLYKKLENNMVQCKTCAQRCFLPEGDFGKCGVRKNKGGTLKVLNYNKAITVSVDPIEKKPLYHFLPGSKSLSFATVGCNFSCNYCQNANISQFQNNHPKKEELPGKKIPPAQIVKRAEKKGCKSIAYTYTEPTIFFEYALDTMKKAHKKGLKNVWITNGFMSKETLSEISPYLDAAAVDLKSFRSEFYKEICKARLKPVIRNLKHLKDNGIWTEVITLLIPEENDTENELNTIAEFIRDKLGPKTPWHISRFFPAYKMKEKPPTDSEKIRQAYQIGKSTGLKYVYAGNVRLPKLTNTYCPNCEKMVIKREGFRAQVLAEDGQCPNCAEEIGGIWD